ncbi:hypothetical protein RF161_02670 [Pasteurella multocida]|uniref:hypothetical protein n=1 Tax=Pasteurella multocida TaxID=747 RepID=UPI00292E0373|nr:hypothetical protein [Pasteurella multocida]
MEGDQYLASFNFPAMERKPKVAGLAVLLGEVSELGLQKICFNRSLRNEINQLEEQNDISFVRVERKGVYGGVYLSYRVASAKDCEKLAKYYNLKASQRGYKPLSQADINEAMNRFHYVDPLAVVDGERIVQKPSRQKANI